MLLSLRSRVLSSHEIGLFSFFPPPFLGGGGKGEEDELGRRARNKKKWGGKYPSTKLNPQILIFVTHAHTTFSMFMNMPLAHKWVSCWYGTEHRQACLPALPLVEHWYPDSPQNILSDGELYRREVMLIICINNCNLVLPDKACILMIRFTLTILTKVMSKP